MAGLVDQILLNIQASVTGAAGVTALTGQIGGLTAKMVALNQGIQIVQQVTASLGTMVNQMGEYARKADAATISARSWQTVLTNFKVDVTEAERVIGSLVDRTGASEIALKGAAAQYIKMGGTLADFEKGALAAASSWSDLTVKTISLDESINNVTLGIAQGRSELMESSGVVVNASQAWEKYADSVGKSVKDLTDQEKAHAYAVAVYKEEELGIVNLAEKQTDLTRAENASTRAKEEMARAIGAVVLPTYTKLVQASADVARTVTDMVNAYRQGGQAMDTFAQKNPQLAAAMDRVRVVVTALRDTARQVFEQSIAPMLDRLAPQAQRVAGVFAPAMDRIQAVLIDLAGIARRAFEQVIIPLFEAVAPVVMQVVQRIVPLLAFAAEAFRDWAQMVVTAWQNIALPVIRAIAPYVSMAVNAVANALGGVIQVIRNVIKAVTAAINGDWSKAWEYLKSAVGTATLAVQSILEGLWKILSDIAVKAWDNAKRLGLNLKDGMIAGLAGLGDKLATELNAALDRATSRIPDWGKRILGITNLQGLIDYVGDAAAAAATQAGSAITGRTEAESQERMRREVSALDPNSFSLKVWQQAFQERGDRFADDVVDYCSRWVRDTLGDARPKARQVIDSLFMRDRNGDGQVEARDAALGAKAAGLMRTYTGTQDLKPGDTVFYTDGGENHVGIYVGDGLVRGNNRLTYRANGGPVDAKGNPTDYTGKYDPVGTVGITQLGRVSGYMSTEALEAYIKRQGVPTPTPTPPPAPSPTPSPTPVVTPVTPPTTKELKDYSLTLADWNKNQARALELAREAEKAESDLTGVRGIQVKTAMERWAGEDKARQQSYQLAVQLTARRAAEAKRTEQDADRAAKEAKQRAEEQARLQAQLAADLRAGRVREAELAASKIEELNRQELAAFKGTASARLTLVRKQSQAEFDAAEQVARIKRNNAIGDAERGPAQLRQQRIDTANLEYQNTVLKLRGDRLDAVRAAQEGVTRAQQEAAEKARQAITEQARAEQQAYRDRRDSAVESIQNLSSAGLNALYEEARANRDQVLLKAFYDEVDRRTAQAKKEVADLWASLDEAAKAAGMTLDNLRDPPDWMRDTPPSSGRTPLRDLLMNPQDFAALANTGDFPDLPEMLLASYTGGDWAQLGTDFLQGLMEGLSGNAAWAAVVAVIRGELDLKEEVTALVNGAATEIGNGFRTGNERPAGDVLGDAPGGMPDYVESLRALDDVALATQLAFAQSIKDGDAVNAVLAEMKRRADAVTAAMNEQRNFDAALQLQSWTESLQGLTDAQLDDALQMAVAGRNLSEYNAIRAEQKRRVDEAAQAEKVAADAAAQTAKTFEALKARVNAIGQAGRPYADLIGDLEKLRTETGANVDEIDRLLAKLRLLQGKDEGLGKFNEYAQYVQQLAGAFGQLGQAVGGDLGANISGVANAASKVADMGMDVARLVASSGADVSAWISLGTKLISTFADMISGWQRAREEAEKARKSFQDAFKFIDAGQFSSFSLRSRGFWADLFGGGPEVVQQVNEVAANIARTIESGVAGAFQTGIKRFLNGEGDILTALREGLRDTVINAVTEAIVQGAVIKGALGKLLTDLTLAAEAQNWDRVAQITGEISGKLPDIATQLQLSLSPLIGAFGSNTRALEQNTQALQAAQFETTTVVSYGQGPRQGRLRARLGGWGA